MDPVDQQLKQWSANRWLITIEQIECFLEKTLKDDVEVLLALGVGQKLVRIAVELQCPLSEP